MVVDVFPVNDSPQTAIHSAGKMLVGPVEADGTVTVDVETDISVFVVVFAASPTATNRLAEIKMPAIMIAEAMAT